MLYVLYLTSCDVISAIFDIAHIGWLLHGVVVVFVANAQKNPALVSTTVSLTAGKHVVYTWTPLSSM